ncbi:LysR family transcriptional regulator [Iodidimonas gelatinilytica]|uniref:LysR family transcriptional regulator n=1 Tax=Iodidimonas gelatinilytica TaxID=1236966 RepID=A0A5A7MP47_9PROT|nr:LysR family transcriptional regulator [Iodidimonas gelatinilytica]GEQ97802.1 LysR family transcriptional regulator [Iodidimonas gelatinilytica]
MDWDRLRIFHIVAEAGSFTTAAKKLHVSQSAASRQVRALEESLNVVLFNRHARGLVLTQEGEQLFRTAREVMQKLETAEQSLLEAKGAPRGTLVVTTMISFGAVWLTPHLTEFVRRYPEIDLQLNLADEDLDLAKRDADVAIRFHAPHQADLIQRPFVKINHHIYASTDYLKRKGVPKTPEDLDHHDIITYGPTPPEAIKDINWTLTLGAHGRQRRPVLQVNNTYAVLQAIEAGIGMAAIPDYLVSHRKGLVRLLPDIDGPAFETYFVYPQELRGSKRVGLFRDFIFEQVRKAGNIM